MTLEAPPVRSVDRAFRLLEAMNRRSVSALDELYRDTRIPKPTIVRLLKAMIHAGYAANDPRQGGYLLTARVQSLSCGFHGDALVVEAGRAWALALTRRLKWPLAIGVLDHDAVVVRFSTIPDSPLAPFHATVNQRLSLVSRALGRAYLAFCSDEEQRLLAALLRASPDPENILARDPPRLEALLSGIRADGFAERDPLTNPRNSSTVAVPIVADGRVLATLGLTYFVSAVPRSVVLNDYAPLLQDAARSIAAHIEAIAPSGDAAHSVAQTP